MFYRSSSDQWIHVWSQAKIQEYTGTHDSLSMGRYEFVPIIYFLMKLPNLMEKIVNSIWLVQQHV